MRAIRRFGVGFVLAAIVVAGTTGATAQELYSYDQAAQQLVRVNVQDGSVTNVVPVDIGGAFVNGVVVWSNKLFALTQNPAQLLEIDLATGAILTTLTLTMGGHTVQSEGGTSDGPNLYVTVNSGTSAWTSSMDTIGSVGTDGVITPLVYFPVHNGPPPGGDEGADFDVLAMDPTAGNRWLGINGLYYADSRDHSEVLRGSLDGNFTILNSPVAFASPARFPAAMTTACGTVYSIMYRFPLPEEPRLCTIDPATGAVLSSIVLPPNRSFRGLSAITFVPRSAAGSDQSVSEGALVTLDGAASSSPCGQPIHVWTQVAGQPVTLNSGDPARPTFVAPSVPVGGATLTFQLVVLGGGASSAADVVNITVTNVNRPPVALAGDDQTVAEASSVTLDGSNSYDSDDETLSFTWLQTGGPPVALMLTDPARPTFTAPIVGAVGATLTFELTLSDGIEIETDTVSVDVENVNHPPVADAGPDQTRVEGANVTLDGSASQDPDADSLGFAWLQVSGPPVTLTNGSAMAPGFTAPQVGLAGAILVFRLTADDGYGGSDDDEVIVTVQDGNAPPVCSLAQPSVTELWPPNHKMVPVTITGVTDPESSAVTITITGVTQDEPIDGLGDGDTAPDAVLQGGTVLLRAERAGGGNGRVYRVTFQASDGQGGTCTGQVTVSVPPSKGKNVPPSIDDGQLYDSRGP